MIVMYLTWSHVSVLIDSLIDLHGAVCVSVEFPRCILKQ